MMEDKMDVSKTKEWIRSLKQLIIDIGNDVQLHPNDHDLKQLYDGLVKLEKEMLKRLLDSKRR